MSANEFEPKEPPSRVRLREANRGLVRWIIVASGLHACIALAASVGFAFQPQPDLSLDSMPVELVRLGKPRDPKLLPRKVPPPPSVKAQRRAPARPSSEGVALDTKAKPKPEKARPSRSRRLSKAARALLEGGDQDLDSVLDKVVPEGQEDGFEQGTTSNPTAAANAYEAKVKAALDEAYELPLTVQSQSRFLNAQVALFIDRNGSIIKYEFIRRHDNKPFMNALERLLRTIKLPPPPRELVSTYRRNGLEIHFTP